MSTTTPNSVSSRPILSVTNHLHGIDNFDEWHFELTTIVLQGEGLTAQATKCADIEAMWSMKGLHRALRVLHGDVEKLRAHQQKVASCSSEASLLSPPTLDALPIAFTSPVAEYLVEHRSTVLAVARAAKGQMDHMVRTELADVERSCALVYASLSDSVRRDAAAANLNKCAHCVISWLRSKFCSEEQKHASAVTAYTKFHTFKFERFVSLEVNLGMFDKLRHSVEKLDGGRTLSDSHLSSALLTALPLCITPDLYVWRGARPSIPYAELRTLLAQYWHDLTLRYPDFLGARPSSGSHGSATAPDVTRTSALHVGGLNQPPPTDSGYGNAFRRAKRKAERVTRGTCDYCCTSGHSTYDCTKLSRAFHQNAVRRGFQFPHNWVAIPPAQLPQQGGGGRRQHGGHGTGYSHPAKRRAHEPNARTTTPRMSLATCPSN